MNLTNIISSYGEGDNSTTDRMWYEVALKICTYLSQLPDKEQVLSNGVYYIDNLIKDTFRSEDDFVDISTRIVNWLLNQNLSMVSRISIEYVRQEIEQISEVYSKFS